MNELLAYLKQFSPDQQAEFCHRCGTSIGYIRKAASVGQKLREGLCINIERESNKAVLCESLRPDVDWAYIRNSAA